LTKSLLRLSLALTVLLYGCAMEIAQPAGSTATSAGSTAEASPTGAGPALPTNIPVTWGSLNLAGKIVYITPVIEENNFLIAVLEMDLVTGDIRTIFLTPPSGWLDAAVVSPDNTQVIISYAPPGTASSFGQQALYIMPLDASQSPELLFAPPTRDDQYIQPAWSPDGKYVYFVHVNHESGNLGEIMRLAYPGGGPEEIVQDALWPRPSGDGSQLVYVSVDPETGLNRMFVAQADGSQPHQVLIQGDPTPTIIDVPMFLPGDETIVFSAPDPLPAPLTPSWFDRLFGMTVAHANGTLPSDWWSVPAAGGEPEQLTNVRSLALYGTLAPDEQWMASFSVAGIFVMGLDGSDVTMIWEGIGGISGTVDWIP
jgi:Tol biopolymer transport system component